MLEIIAWIVTAFSLAGVVLNIYRKRVCFVIWLHTNVFWVVYDLYKQVYPQAAVFGVYAALAAWGIYKWRRPR